MEILACITSDPALKTQPNFESPAYAPCITALENTGLTPEQALAQLVEGWNGECQEWITRWQQQLEEEARNLQEIEDREREEREAAEAEEHLEAEKKKPKINDFNINLSVPDVIVPRPCQSVLQKIKNREFIELWYFSPDGCREARDQNKSTAEDAFGLTRVDGFVALKSVSSFKASNKALQDHDLSWRQFDMAKTSFLIHIEKSGWLEKHQQALTLFFTLITNHEYRLRPRGEKTLLRYASMVRRDWHDRLSLDQGFNIGIFNSALYNSISDDVWDNEREETIRMVRICPYVIQTHN